jgi:hypothetical protein
LTPSATIFSASMSRPESVSSSTQSFGSSTLHLQDFGALLLAAGKADIERALQHFHRDVELVGRFLDQADEVRRGQFGLAARLALLVHRHLEELHGRHARDFHRVLEREEQAGSGALGGVHLQDALAIVE